MTVAGKRGVWRAGISLAVVAAVCVVIPVAGPSQKASAAVPSGTPLAWGSNGHGQVGDGTSSNVRSMPVAVAGLPLVTAMAAGGHHSLALKPDGTVWAWGDNTYGQLGDNTTTERHAPVQVDAPGGVGTFNGITAIAAGENYSLALTAAGTVFAWGDNADGQLGNSTTTNSSEPVVVPGLGAVVAIAAGANHSLALKGDGTVWAWGFNADGELGDNDTFSRSFPVQVAGPIGTATLGGIVAIAAGGYHNLALTQAGEVWAWGYNISGQLGDNTTTNSSRPVQVKAPGGAGALGGVTAIAAGGYHNLALKSDGTVWTWGRNTYGGLGNNTTTDGHLPAQAVGPGGTGTLSGVTAVVAGAYHSAAVKADGTMWAWGYNAFGQLGDDTFTNRTSPTLVRGIGAVIGLAAGPLAYHALAVGPSSSPGPTVVEAWGDNSYGKLGGGTTAPSAGAVETAALGGVTAVASGSNHSLAVKLDGTVWAWGFNEDGELGNNTTTNSSVPVHVAGPGGSGTLAGVTAIAAGLLHSLAVKSDGTVWAWGYNGNGELGRNSLINSSVPVQVTGPGGTGTLAGVTAIAAGADHSLALKSDGTVWAWGTNAFGQLGNNTTSNSSVPVQVTGPGGTGTLAGVTAIAAGGYHNLALKSDGTVWTWGYNAFGQLGNNTTTNSSVPVQVAGPGGTGTLAGVTAIAAGGYHNLAVMSDGTVWTWGYNGNGELGRNSLINSSVPVQVVGPGGIGTLAGVTAIAAGRLHSLALKSDGTVWAWGDNASGQLGNNTTTTSSVPVQALGVAGVAALGTGPTAQHSLAVVPLGELRVATNPAVASQISVDGHLADSWGLTWLKLAPGAHVVHFSHVEGYTEPADQTVTVIAGAVTTLNANFTPRGELRVITSPALPSAISVDGQVRDEYGMWTDIPTGSHQVCFGAVAGFNPPGCQTVTVNAGAETDVTGTFAANSSALGQAGVGQLRVTTTPAVGSQISINGHIADSWGLAWAELPPGSYTVHFSHVEGYTDPADQTVTVNAGQTTTVNGNFTARGELRVLTNPAAPGTVLLNTAPADDWGQWTDVPTGTQTVCFGPAAGYTNIPSCQTPTVGTGTLTTVTAGYS